MLTSSDELSYIRAFEVGYPPTSAKYDLAVRLRTPKNGPVVRNRIRLPHPVKTDLRICVICPPDSQHAAAAKKAGAAVVGEDTVFDAVKAGRIEFDRCICHPDSLQKLNKAGIARILGPKGLMPSAKFGTVVRDVAASVKELVGASEYREREAVLRLSIGQLGFSPEELQRNIKSFMAQIKRELGALSDRVTKEVHEVVRHLPRRTPLQTDRASQRLEADLLSWSVGLELNAFSGLQSQRHFQESRFSGYDGALYLVTMQMYQ